MAAEYRRILFVEILLDMKQITDYRDIQAAHLIRNIQSFGTVTLAYMVFCIKSNNCI